MGRRGDRPFVIRLGGGNGSKAEVSALPSKYSDVGTRWDSEERARGLHFAFMEFHDARVNQKFRVVHGCGVMGGGACSKMRARRNKRSPNTLSPPPLDGRRLDVAKL